MLELPHNTKKKRKERELVDLPIRKYPITPPQNLPVRRDMIYRLRIRFYLRSTGEEERRGQLVDVVIMLIGLFLTFAISGRG